MVTTAQSGNLPVYVKSFETSGSMVTGKDFVDLSKVGRPALIVVDMQAIFVHSGARFAIPGASDLVPRINELVRAVRSVGGTVVWVQTDYTPPMGGLAIRKWRAFQEGALQRGKPGFELCDGLEPVDEDYFLTKYTYSAFEHTELEEYLRNGSVDSVVVVGVSTEGCCDSTYRSAFFRGFLPVIVSDACASSAGEEFSRFYTQIQDKTFGRAMTTDEVLAELAEREGASSR